jgi:hypothetical protein
MNEKRWSDYQIKTEKGVADVSKLTEEQAKDELCKMIDLVESFNQRVDGLEELIERWRNGK